MNKNSLLKELSKKFELPMVKTNAIVSTILEIVTKSLVKGKFATFIGFGTFSVKRRNSRAGRNPQIKPEKRSKSQHVESLAFR